MERFIGDLAERDLAERVHAHRAPDLPVPVDEPMPEPHPNHPHHPDAPVEQDDPVPDRNPE